MHVNEACANAEQYAKDATPTFVPVVLNGSQSLQNSPPATVSSAALEDVTYNTSLINSTRNADLRPAQTQKSNSGTEQPPFLVHKG